MPSEAFLGKFMPRGAPEAHDACRKVAISLFKEFQALWLFCSVIGDLRHAEVDSKSEVAIVPLVQLTESNCSAEICLR
jgi:hypothetical protein